MKIVESDVRMTSSHQAEYRYSMESLTTSSFRTVLQDQQEAASDGKAAAQKRIAKMLEDLVDSMLAAMEGKKCRSPLADDALPSAETADTQSSGKGSGFQQAVAMPTRVFEWQRTVKESIHDYEHTRVEGSGTIKTADGREIAFNLKSDFCRDFSCEREYQEGGSVKLMDPIVLNFDGKAAELTDDRIPFDLDVDGKTDTLAGLGKGSGYLVLDRNSNGKVDNGSELFGAQSGNGFADLAKLDSDGNGWLDEGDAAFSTLRLWDGKPDDGMKTLADQGVGAIWLGSVRSPFALKDGANQLLGEIRSAGVYLREDGQAGMVQQLDLADLSNPAAGNDKPGQGTALSGKQEGESGDIGSLDLPSRRLQRVHERADTPLERESTREQCQVESRVGAA